MKFNCGLTEDEKSALRTKQLEERLAARRQWHVKFAWWPVQIRSGLCIWLGYYERREVTKYNANRNYGDSHYITFWEYRESEVTAWVPRR